MTAPVSDLDRRNIRNLTALWTSMGVRATEAPVVASSLWPHRVWLPWDVSAESSVAASLADVARDLPAPTVPVWPHHRGVIVPALAAAGLIPRFSLTAMARTEAAAVVEPTDHLELRRVRTPSLADVWTETASQSFGYVVDRPVPRRLLDVESAELYLALRSGTAVGTALLFVDDSAVGVHMMGVVPAARRQGIARRIMEELLRRASTWPDRPVVLQASAAGEPLYASLGFEPRFAISHFGRAVV